MKILAITLENNYDKGVVVNHGYFEIKNETPSFYRLDKTGILVNHRSMIKKEEINTIMFNELFERRSLNKCDYISLQVWAIVEEESTDILNMWKERIKSHALKELKRRHNDLKNLYSEVKCISANEEE